MNVTFVNLHLIISQMQVNILKNIILTKIKRIDIYIQRKTLSKSTGKILIWKCLHRISMVALKYAFFSDFLPPKTSKLPKTNQKILDEMCDQFFCFNFQRTRWKTVSLILDGGTVNHTKWFAVFFFFFFFFFFFWIGLL